MLRIFPALLYDFRFRLRFGKSLLFMLEKFLQIAFKTENRKLIFFAHQFAFRADDLKTVCSRRIGGRRDKGTRRAVREFKLCRYIVFRFDLMPFSEMAECAHFRRHHPANPLQQIQLMGTLIEQNAAAFPLPSGAPCAGIRGNRYFDNLRNLRFGKPCSRFTVRHYHDSETHNPYGIHFCRF